MNAPKKLLSLGKILKTRMTEKEQTIIHIKSKHVECEDQINQYTKETKEKLQEYLKPYWENRRELEEEIARLRKDFSELFDKVGKERIKDLLHDEKTLYNLLYQDVNPINGQLIDIVLFIKGGKRLRIRISGLKISFLLKGRKKKISIG